MSSLTLLLQVMTSFTSEMLVEKFMTFFGVTLLIGKMIPDDNCPFKFI